MDNDEMDEPTSSMQGILAVALQVHQTELSKRDEQIRELHYANDKLKEEYSALQQRYNELKQSSNKEKVHMLSANQHYEQKLASMDLQIKGLESEQQEHASEVAHLASERDKANHIIKNLLSKVRSPARG